MRDERGSADLGALSAIFTAVAALFPPVAFLSPSVQDTLGDIGLIISAILGIIAVARILVLAGRAYTHIQRIPNIDRRLENLEDALGVKPPPPPA